MQPNEWRWRPAGRAGRHHVFRFQAARISACGCARVGPVEILRPGEMMARIPGADLCATCSRMYRDFLISRRKSLRAENSDAKTGASEPNTT